VKVEKSLAVEKVPFPPPNPSNIASHLVPISDFKPRLIQAPPDVVHVVLGPYTKTIMHFVEGMWTYDSPFFYAGGATPIQLDLWLQEVATFTDCHFIMADFEMYDCTHSEMSFSVIEKFYSNVLLMPFQIVQRFKDIRIPVGVAENIRYTAPHPMNGSGRPDTSLLNIVGNMVGQMIQIAHAVSGIPVEELTPEIVFEICELPGVKIVAAGDDSVVVIPFRLWWRAPNELRARWYYTDITRVEYVNSLLGFRVPKEKQIITPDHRRIVFLGQMPFPVVIAGNVEWFWGPTLGRRLFKHHTYLKPTGDLRAWLHGVARMEEICYPHVPILYDQAVAVCTQMAGQKINAFFDPEAEFKPKIDGDHKPHYDQYTIDHVEWYYDLPQGFVKEAIAELGAVPQVLLHPIYTAMLLVDDC
jgi:hypothetical protein